MTFDTTCILLIVFVAALGILRGFFKSLLYTCTFILSSLTGAIAMVLLTKLGTYFDDHIMIRATIYISALIVFVVSYLVIKNIIVGLVLESTNQQGLLSRLGGMVWGTMIGLSIAFVLFLCMLLINSAHYKVSSTKELVKKSTSDKQIMKESLIFAPFYSQCLCYADNILTKKDIDSVLQHELIHWLRCRKLHK